MYELPSRSLRRLLPSLVNPVSAGLWVAAWIALLLGGWTSIAGGVFLVLWTVSSYRMNLTADKDGLTVTTRFLKRHVAWADVVSISSANMTGSYAVGRTVLIDRRHQWFPLPVMATSGMGRDQYPQIARDLVALARSYGYSTIGGSAHETAVQQAAADGWTVDPPESEQPTRPPGPER